MLQAFQHFSFLFEPLPFFPGQLFVLQLTPGNCYSSLGVQTFKDCLETAPPDFFIEFEVALVWTLINCLCLLNFWFIVLFDILWLFSGVFLSHHNFFNHLSFFDNCRSFRDCSDLSRSFFYNFDHLDVANIESASPVDFHLHLLCPLLLLGLLLQLLHVLLLHHLLLSLTPLPIVWLLPAQFCPFFPTLQLLAMAVASLWTFFFEAAQARLVRDCG